MPNLGKSGQNSCRGSKWPKYLQHLQDKEGVKVISSKVQCDQIGKMLNLGENWPKQLPSPEMAKLSTSNLKKNKT